MNEFNFENQRRTFHSYGMKFIHDLNVIIYIISDFKISWSHFFKIVTGYAVDPSVDLTMGATPKVVGVAPENASAGELKTVFETIKARPKDKRKRLRNDNPEDVEGFLGPWGAFENQEHVSKPTEVIMRISKLCILFYFLIFILLKQFLCNQDESAELEAILAKRKKRQKNVDDKPMEEKNILHIKDPVVSKLTIYFILALNFKTCISQNI